MAENYQFINIFDFMCGKVLDVFAELGGEALFNKIFYELLLDKLRDCADTEEESVFEKSLKSKIKMADDRGSGDDCIDENSKFLVYRKDIILNFLVIKEIIISKSILVQLIEVGKIQCLLVTDVQNDYQTLCFAKDEFCKTERYLAEYIIKHTHFCASNKCILGFTQGESTVESMYETQGVAVKRVGKKWLVNILNYIEDIKFVQNKVASMINNIACEKDNDNKQKGKIKNKFAYSQFNKLYGMLDYYICCCNLQKRFN